MKKIIKTIKKIWKDSKLNFIVPIISLIISVLAFIKFGITLALILFTFINLVYFTVHFINKKINKKKKKKKGIKYILKLILLIFLTCFIFGIIAVIGFIGYVVVNAPEFNEELLYVQDPSIVLNKDGEEIAKLGEEKRITLTYDEIPEVLVDAIVATEDSRFFEHNGVDWARFIKASFFQLLGKSEAGGASTLTMQVSKNAYTSTEDEGIEGIIRKFTDIYVSMFLIEKNYTKEQIMEFYVNSHWLAKNTYGIEQTALTYFGKSAKELNLSEAAMMAGLFQAPGRYDPYKYPEKTEKRRQTVLYLMLRHEYITKEEYNIAMEMTVDKIVIPKEESIYSSGLVSPYQSFIDTVVDEVKEKTKKDPYKNTMIIHTTLDTNIQDYVNDIMNGETYNWENEVVQAGIAIINVNDGSVAALGGQRNVDAIDTLSYATEIKEQIGSTAKPLFDYGPAVEYNNWSSYNIIVDEPITYSDGTPINNWNRTYEGFETARIALMGSRNIPALKTFKKNNKSDIIEFVTNLGLTPEIYSCNEGYDLEGKYCINLEDPSIIIDANKSNTLHEAHAIGGYNGESPLTLTAAYAAFANNGVYVKPYTFTKIIFPETEEEFINDIEKTRAMSEETAYIISDMLATTATYAMGYHYNINGIRYAAKTGTTNFDIKTIEANGLPYNAVNDLWTVGYNTEYALGVWYGYGSINPDYYNTVSNSQHTRLFQAVGKKIFTNRNYFTKPSGVVEVEVESGCPEATLPSKYTPEDLRQKELFIKGTEPTNVSTRFEQLDDVSNLKSNIKDDIITLTWDEEKMPEINTESYLKKYFSKVFENESYLNEHVSGRLDYIKRKIGIIGYNVYLKDSDGELKLLEYISSNEYEFEAPKSGTYTFVIKTAYSIFKDNMSKGKEISVKAEIKNPLLPEDDENSTSSETSNETSKETSAETSKETSSEKEN